jgi:hypothetical protein
VRVSWIAGVLGTWCWCATALAQAPAVSTELDPCVPVDAGRFERLLSIELGTSGAADARGVTHVEVTCSDRGIELRLEDGVTRKTMARVLPADSFRDASSTRLLALAVAEFVVASWTELTLQPEPAVEPVGPPPPPEVRRVAEGQARERQRAVARLDGSVTVGVGATVWTRDRFISPGLSLRLLDRPVDYLAWTLSVDAGVAHADVPLGAVTIQTVSATVGIGTAYSVDGAVFYTGPSARLGYTRMESESADQAIAVGDSFTDAFAGLLWWVRAELHPSRHIRVAFDLELGAITLPARAKALEEEVLAVDGIWIGASVGGGVAF